MFDRYIPCSLENFVPIETPDAPLPPPGAPPGPKPQPSHGKGMVREMLSHLQLSDLDLGDLLLLGLFVYLLQKKADEELLIALGLLLIL